MSLIKGNGFPNSDQVKNNSTIAGATVTEAMQNLVVGGGSGDMLKSVYDINLNGIVDNSEKLNSQLPSYYLARANQTGTQLLATISDAGNSAGLNTGTTGVTVALGNHLHSGVYEPANANIQTFIASKGLANGLVPLNASSLIDSLYLPAYVDDVLEFANLAGFPTTGLAGKIYVALDTNLTYRWGGTTYVEISASLALGTTSSTAFRGDYGNTAYQHTLDSTIHFTQGAISIPNAQITDFQTGITNNVSVLANTAKVGITPTQAGNIATNNAKVSYTEASIVALNTANRHASSLIGTKTINEIAIGDTKVVAYDLATDTLVYVANAGGGAGINNTTWAGANWVSTTAGESELQVQNALKEVGIDYADRASSLIIGDTNSVIEAYYNAGGFANTTLDTYNSFLKAFWQGEDLTDAISSNDWTGSSITFTAGYNNNAFTFNGTSSYGTQTVGTLQPTTSLMFSVLLKKPTSGVWEEIINGTGNNIALDISPSGNIRFIVSQSDTTFISVTTSAAIIRDNTTWNQVIAIAENGILNIWINSIKDINSANFDNTFLTISDLYLGRDLAATGYYNGQIDEFLYYTNLSFVDATAKQDYATVAYNSGIIRLYAPNLVQKYQLSTAKTTDITANTAHSSTVTGNPHNVLVPQITDFATGVTNNVSVLANTAKVGITPTQAGNITTNNAKISYTEASIVALNTAFRTTPSSAITAGTNLAWVGNTLTANGWGTVQGTGVNTYNIRATNEGAIVGNARGENSVDLQTVRNSATQIGSGANSVISGGRENTVSSSYSTISGGIANNVAGSYGTISGGKNNFIGVNSSYSTISGGLLNNIINAWESCIIGGISNVIQTGQYSCILGGTSNQVKWTNSTVLGGDTNFGEAYASIVGGKNNTANAYGEVKLGVYSYTRTGQNQIASISSDSLFTLGNGTGIGANSSDAFRVLKSGATMIGLANGAFIAGANDTGINFAQMDITLKQLIFDSALAGVITTHAIPLVTAGNPPGINVTVDLPVGGYHNVLTFTDGILTSAV